MRVSTMRTMTQLTPLMLVFLTACYRDDPPSGGTCFSEFCENEPYPFSPTTQGPELTCSSNVEMPRASLVVTDPMLLGNTTQDRPLPWSFAARVQALATNISGSQALVHAWLGSWKQRQQVFNDRGEPHDIPVSAEPRPHVRQRLACPWLKLRPQNGCDDACSACTSEHLELEQAPFDLLAIVNRMDLAEDANPCSNDGGELRLVYTAVEPGTHRPLAMTVIFEYGVTLPAGKNRKWLAQRWHELARHDRAQAQSSLMAWLAPMLAEARLLRVRTNEQIDRAGGPWELRQFVVGSAGGGQLRLLPTVVPDTPPLSFTNSHELASIMRSAKSSILAGHNKLPPSMVTATAVVPTASFTWQATGADATTLQAFNRNTCNGCHGALTGGGPGFQHISSGNMNDTTAAPAALSGFLLNPNKAAGDELSRRGESLRLSLCGPCGAHGDAAPADGAVMDTHRADGGRYDVADDAACGD